MKTGGKLSASRLIRSTPGIESLQNPLDRRLDAIQRRYGCCGDEKNLRRRRESNFVSPDRPTVDYSYAEQKYISKQVFFP